MQVSNDVLRDFWHADDASDGFAHENIAYELARRLKPKAPMELLKFIYPAVKTSEQAEEIDVELRRLIDRGFFKWKNPKVYAERYWKRESPNG